MLIYHCVVTTMTDHKTKTPEHEVVLAKVLVWSKAIEGVMCVERGAPMKEPFETMCLNMLEQAQTLLPTLTRSMFRVAVQRLIDELLRDRKHWLDKVVALSTNRTEVNYSIATIKSRTLAAAIGFISGVVAVATTPHLEEKKVPWVYEPIGGSGPMWSYSETQLKERDTRKQRAALEGTKRITVSVIDALFDPSEATPVEKAPTKKPQHKPSDRTSKNWRK